MKRLLSVLAIVALSAALYGCGPQTPTSDQVQRQQQEALSQQSNATVGMPAIVNFREKKLLKMIFEMRDKAIATHTYITDNQGHLHKKCDSVGYGIPYATQFTNPQRTVWDGHYSATLPQADPNGLFSPPSADGTWVLCSNPAEKSTLAPVFFEPRVIVSPFPLLND